MKTIKIEMTIEDWNELAKAAEDLANYKKWYFEEKEKNEMKAKDEAAVEARKQELIEIGIQNAKNELNR